MFKKIQDVITAEVPVWQSLVAITCIFAGMHIYRKLYILEPVPGNYQAAGTGTGKNKKEGDQNFV